jgi:hypothetical protein
MCADRHLPSPSSKKSEESTVLNSMTRWIYRRLTKELTWIKIFTGIRAEDFWLMIDKMESAFYEYKRKRRNRD